MQSSIKQTNSYENVIEDLKRDQIKLKSTFEEEFRQQHLNYQLEFKQMSEELMKTKDES